MAAYTGIITARISYDLIGAGGNVVPRTQAAVPAA